jgi:CHAD domain-containing protein
MMPRSAERYDLLRKRLDRFTRMLQGVEEGNVQAVHRARVASRRLREVLPVLQLDAEVTRKLSRRLKRITDRLGTIRELDVLLGLIEEFATSGRYPKSAVTRVAAAVADDRRREGERVLSKHHLRELRRVHGRLKKVAAALAEEPQKARSSTDRDSCRWAIEARVARRAATVVAALADAGAVYLPERLHVVRIAVKKLRYALELSAEVAGLKSNPDLRMLRRAQDVLGRLHDLQLLTDRAREVQASMTPPDLATWRQLDALVLTLEDNCRRLHGRYMHDAPALTAICTRLAGRARSRTPAAALGSQAGAGKLRVTQR